MRLLSAIVLMGALGGCSLVAGSGDGLPCDPACDANASCVLGRCVVPTPRRIAKECVEGEDETQCGPNEECVLGTCVSTTRCTTTADCPADEYCAADGSCRIRVTCDDDTDCDDGRFCNGLERCNPTRGECELAGSDCVAPASICDEDADACFECLSDSDCDNGAFCDGAEVCEQGTCMTSSSSPCEFGCDAETDLCLDCIVASDCGQPCEDGEFTCDAGRCNQKSEGCDKRYCEANGAPDGGRLCYDCQQDSDCNNGLRCDGVEVCNLADRVCIVSPGTENPCAGNTNSPNCEDGSDGDYDCVACSENADCDDGLFCNGAEYCEDSRCRRPSDDVCPNNGPTPYCNEDEDRCMVCEKDGDCADGDPCTIDICVDGDRCTHDERCPGEKCYQGACGECASDADCPDDGEFCNGAEVCRTQNQRAVCRGRGDPCPWFQRCDEPNDRCVQCLFDSNCDNFNPCDGIETCDNNNQCRPGNPVQCPQGSSCGLFGLCY